MPVAIAHQDVHQARREKGRSVHAVIRTAVEPLEETGGRDDPARTREGRAALVAVARSLLDHAENAREVCPELAERRIVR